MLALRTHRMPSWAVRSPAQGHTASCGRVGLWPDLGPAHSSHPKPGACAQVPAATPAWRQSTQASCPARTVSENPASMRLPLPSGETRCPLRPSPPPPTSRSPSLPGLRGPLAQSEPTAATPWVSLHPVHLGWVLFPFIYLFKVCFCTGGSPRSPVLGTPSTVGIPRMLDERRPHSSPSSQHQLTFHSAGLEPSEAGHPPAHGRQAVRASEGRLQRLGGSPRAAATSGGVPTATLRGREGTPLGRRWSHLASGDKPLGLRNVSVVSGCSRRFRTSRHVGPPCGQTVRREGSRRQDSGWSGQASWSVTGPWGCGDQVAWRPLAADAATEVLCPATTPGTLLEAATPLRARPAHHVVPHRLGGQRHVTDKQAPSLAPTSPGPARLAAPGCVALMPRVVRVHSRAAPRIGPHLRPPLLASQGSRTVCSLCQVPGRPHRFCLLLAPQAGAQWGASGLLLHLPLANFNSFCPYWKNLSLLRITWARDSTLPIS